jgi:hypothetical protein
MPYAADAFARLLEADRSHADQRGRFMTTRVPSLQRACRLEFGDQGVLKGLALGWWRDLEGKRQRTEAIHGRARFVQVPKQTLSDIVAFPQLDPSLRGAEAIDA